MSLSEIIVIAVGLSMDALAVAIATGMALGTISKRQFFRLSFHFGLFQALMPTIGWMAGSAFVDRIKTWDHWIAFGLLAFVGGKAIYEALSGCESEKAERDPTKGLSLVTLSTATSIDALAVGFSFAMLQVSIVWPVIIIGIVAGTITLAGMRFGKRLGSHFGRSVEVLGGLVLIAIGLKILFHHLLRGI